MPSPRSLPHALVRSAAGWSAFVLLLTAVVLLLPDSAGTASAAAQPAATALPPGAGAASNAEGATAEEATPLSVTIGSLSPSTVPKSGPLKVTGTVTNTDSETWEDVHVYAFLGDTPMTSTAELSDAGATDEAAYVGNRITETGTYATLPRIDPGATVSYQLSVPRRLLPKTEGVYWFGAHALGNNDDPVEGPRADGRARTFLTVLDRPQAREPVPTSFVVPLRRRIVRAEDGRVAQVSGWTRALSSGGRLRELVDTALAAGDRPVTWLIDPAVLAAVHQLADGNLPRDALPAEDGDGQEPSESPSAGSSETGSPSTSSETPEQVEANARAAEAASDWLSLFDSARAGTEVLALPYGDTDLAAVGSHHTEIYDQARERSEALMAEWGISATLVDAPLSGYADRDALELGTQDTPIFLADRAFSGAYGSVVPAVVSTDGRRVLTASTGAADGGPEPEPTDTGVALRQRIIAEAGVHAISADQGDDPVQPLLVVMPGDWDPNDSSGLFDGLEQPWLNLRTVTSAESGRQADTSPSRPSYPNREADQELPVSQLDAAEDLDGVGQTLQRVLTRNDQVATQVRDEALTGTSYQVRNGKGSATERSFDYIDGQLGSITLAANKVTLSSATGSFPVSVTNSLDHPVTVALQPFADSGMTVTPPDAVEVPPRGQMTVLMEAHAERNGLHTVSVVLTDTEGTALGSQTTVPIRAAEVSSVIWVFLGVGAALLFAAIAVRLIRRIRRRGHHDDGPPGEADDAPEEPDGAPEQRDDQQDPRVEGPA